MKGRLLSVLTLFVLVLAGFTFPRNAHACDPVYHVVKPGQNLTQIARYYGVTVQAIVKANNLWNPNLIYPGQCLLIPVPCQPPPPSGCTSIHVVRRGEYLKMIAARYGTTVSAIVRANGIRNPNLIYPGQRLKIPTSCRKPTPTPPPPPPGAWKGQFWANRYLSGSPKLIRNYSLVDFQWGKGGPGGGIGQDNFSARWKRARYLDAGRYRFHIKVDDGVRFWVDGVMLIGEWHDTAPKEYTAERELSAGNHSLQIDYYEHTGGAQIKFWIEPLDIIKAWKGEFFNNMNLVGPPTVTKNYGSIDFDWGNRAPEAGITADYFSVRWTGEFNFTGGQYRFTATADDGIRVYVDDGLIVDEWHDTSARTYTVDVDVSAGAHRLKVEHYEHEGAAVAKVQWTKR
jgi:LysM repeat protein